MRSHYISRLPDRIWDHPNLEAEFLIGKVRKRLRHWSTRMLSWDSKVVLLRHVLRAIPSYHLMVLAPNRKGYDGLEKSCKQFLWGVNEEGKLKKALITWEDITHPKKEGGLDVRLFKK